ncbi:MAG: SRPBCC family protein [Anaerolineales bacterium]
MKKFLKLIGILAGIAVLVVLIIIALMPWMDRWGATDDEIAASFLGDELVPSPAVTYTRAVTVNATPAEIYPWLVQMGAEKGGMYSYSWFETNVLRCELINADRIHNEWQGLKVGDAVRMCPGEWGPPAYEAAIIKPNKALVIGHQENGEWLDVWQFVLIPQTDGTTRLVARGRDTKTGTVWDVIRPGQFIMERGMLLGIKERAEVMAQGR